VACRDRRAEHPPHLWTEITTSESGLLIGEHGSHLRALEHILRILLRDDLGSACRFFVDVNAYRLRRMEFLKRLARDSARRVAESHHAVTLDPMPAMDRRIVHLALTSEALVETASIGQEPERRVVIRPRDPFLTPGQTVQSPLEQRSAG
jgi:spoIIIJ-associated protein